MNGACEVGNKVRVFVIDDSAFMRAALRRMISSEADFEVVGTSSSGSEALDRILQLDPDVITLDLQMPGLDGLATLRCIMRRFPRPVIMVSAATDKDAEITFNALSAGAFDYVPKQMSPASLEIAHIRADLIAKIRAAAQARRFHNSFSLARKPPDSVATGTANTDCLNSAVIAIGASTGGPHALEQILPCLPADLPVPVLVVQHMPQGFTSSFARRLSQMCGLQVHEAEQGELVRAGVAYICPAGLHMRVLRQCSNLRVVIDLSASPGNCLHVPSVDVLMQSVAKIYRNLALGIIMTGMGSDGTEGMKAIYQAGGMTIGQDEGTCAVYGMPRACAEAGVLRRVVPISEIPLQILQATRKRRPA